MVEGELESIAVHEAHQGRGVGTKLLRAVLDWAGTQGTEEVVLEVRARSTQAIRLYRRLGFIATGLRPAYYDLPADDAISMSCALTASEPEAE